MSLHFFRARLLLLVALAVACSDQERPAPQAVSRTVPEPAATGTARSPNEGQASQKSEDIAALSFQQARQFLLKGEPVQAEAELQRTVTLNPRMSEGFFELGKLEVHLSSRGLSEEGRDLACLERGLVALTRAVELEPNNDEYLFWLGRVYSLKDDKAAAIQHLEKAVQLNPKNAQAWKRLGLVHLQDAHTEQARDCFAKSVEADATDAGAHFQHGKALATLARPAEARAAYEKAIEVDPTEPEYYQQLAQILHQLGDEEGASRAEQGYRDWEGYAAKRARRMRAVNQRPNDAAALRRLGEVHFEVGQWSEAEVWFLKAINVDPKDALAHLYFGSVRRQAKDYEVATNHLREAEFLAPDNLDAKLELVRLYADMGQTENLSGLVAAVEASADTSGEWLYSLGEVCKEVGRLDDASRLLEKAKALGVIEAPEESPAPTEEQ